MTASTDARELLAGRTSVLDKLGGQPESLVAFQSVCRWTEDAASALTAQEGEIKRLREGLVSLCDGDCTYDGSDIRIHCDSHSDTIARMRIARTTLADTGRAPDA